jgi:hypothetical protein
MASNLSRSCFCSPTNLEALRRVLGWQASGYKVWLRYGVGSPLNLRPREFGFFACYATAGLVPPVSSFLFTLLEFYGLQLKHLSPHSFVLVAIFIHFCKMFVDVRLSIPLFWLFRVLCWAEKGTNLIDTYYF